MSGVVETEFPTWGLLPKRETGVQQFLQNFPTYDGAGTIIAIFDSGIDPGAPGLKITSDGKTKIIETYDCSGAGDVDTSTVVKPEADKIIGLTGRKLTIPADWNNPSGEYHIGVKNAFELYPVKLRERIEKHRKEKLWDPFHKEALAEISRIILDVDPKNSDSNSFTAKFEKEDREAKQEHLQLLEKKSKDLGPAYDCILFHDGSCWRACIDTTEKGDLENALLLGEYSVTHEFGPLTEEDQYNVSVNVYNDGNCLEIVGMCSPHGTHVASIAAAYFPDEPEKNGVAPGAQIISLTIGDNRLGSMETGTGIVRAMIRVMQHSETNPVHVINMSYGEHSNWSGSGRIGEIMKEIVGKYNVSWVSSAGNHGPGLCTVSTPPDISTDSIIGVGAYVSPDMMLAEYSMREKLPGSTYTWSSRGPTIDGGHGVSVCAPGGAITSVPNYALSNAQLMNGTSMASPHVAGAVALLISGLLQRNLPVSSHQIKRALENTAQFLPNSDPFAQGFGLLRVEKAFEYLCQFNQCIARDVRFALQCGNFNTKGVHVRAGRADKPKEVPITVEPVFRDNTDHTAKINFNLRLSLTTNENWLQISPFLDLNNSPRVFSIRIDPTTLSDGAHTTCVNAYDVACVEKGPVFRVPVTVIQPTVCTGNSLKFTNVSFKPNEIKRHFILVPETATWVLLKVHCEEKNTTGRFFVHCLQLRRNYGCKAMEFQKYFTFTSNSVITHGFSCIGGLILEVVVAKYWSSLGETTIDYEIDFHGTKLDARSFTMQGAEGIYSIEINSGLQSEALSPQISLQNAVLVLRPVENKIIPGCKVRDVIPPSRQIYENVLTYNIHVGKTVEIQPRSGLLCELLYESEFESQLWMLFDSNKQWIASGDAYPSKYSVKVEKGEYVLKLHVRHEKRDLLEKLSDMPLLVSQKLSTAISLDIYVSQSQAMIQGKKFGVAIMAPGRHVLPIYIAPLTNDKTLKNLPPCHFLQGTISFPKDEIGKKADVYPFKYVLPEASKKSNRKENSKEKEKTKFEEYEEACRDLKLQWLTKMDDKTKASTLYEELMIDYPDSIQVHVSYLQYLDSTDIKKFGVLPFFDIPESEQNNVNDLISTNEEIIAIADKVISSIDISEILAYFGMKADLRPDASKTKQIMERNKSAILEALCKKGCSLCRLCLLNSDEKASILDTLNELWQDIFKLTDQSDSKITFFLMWHAALNSHLGRLIKYLQKLVDEKPAKELDNLLVEVYQQLGWSHLSNRLKSAIAVCYPLQYRPF